MTSMRFSLASYDFGANKSCATAEEKEGRVDQGASRLSKKKKKKEMKKKKKKSLESFMLESNLCSGRFLD
jgi:hypothetical protein